jgi:hypothetical protein
MVTAVTASTEVAAESDPPGGHDGHGMHDHLGHRAGGPDGAGQDNSCDIGAHGDHGAVTARTKRARRVMVTRRILAIAEAPGGARTPRSDHGSGPPSESNRLRPAGGAPTTPPFHLRPRGRKTTQAWGRKAYGQAEEQDAVTRG